MRKVTLVGTGGASSGGRIEVAGSITLGRELDGPASLDDSLVSRRHARIWQGPDGTVLVEDLGSTNGTFVNGERIDGAKPLVDGDVVEVGGTMFRLELAPDLREDARRERTLGGESAGDLRSTSAIGDPDLKPVEQVGSPSEVRDRDARARQVPASDGHVLHGGRRHDIPAAGLAIGREADNDLVLGSDLVSRYHATIVAQGDRWYIADLGSTNGTSLNGELLVRESRWLNPGDTVEIGGETLHFLAGGLPAAVGPASVAPAFQPAVSQVRAQQRITIGRDPSNDVVLDAPNVSRFHAELQKLPDGRFEVRDLRSRVGTRLDSQPVATGTIVAGSEIGIGPFRLVFDGKGFVHRDDRGAIRLEAREVSVAVRGRLILDRGSLRLQPGELVGLIGESGAGKSTLIKVLAGVRRPTGGVVLVNGQPVWVRRGDIGYLPQDEIVHPRLTVLESLRYSARLRLPLDSVATEIDSAVQRVLTDMSLVDHSDTRIASLSGGQRKRVGLATEMLSSPGLLFLDEPTTGLDPGLESRMMQLFRTIATERRSGVIVATHATKSLNLADTLWVVGRGGHLCFVGSPADAQTFFGVDSFDDIYSALEERPAEEWRAEFERSAPARAAQPEALAVPSPSRVGRNEADLVKAQTRVLLHRYTLVFARDVRNLLILLLQAPLLGIAMCLLFKPDVFGPPGVGSPNAAAQLLFVLVTTVIWLGTIDAAREVIKERAILARERAAGVDPRAYLASKLALLSAVAGIQTVALMTAVVTLRPLHEPGTVVAKLLAILLGTALVAVATGLFISTLSRSEDQATALIPIVMIVQLLFGGAIVTVHNMGGAIAALSMLVFERWSFAGAGSAIGMNDRIASDPTMSVNNPYGDEFFDLPLLATLAILAVFLVALLAATMALLLRDDTTG